MRAFEEAKGDSLFLLDGPPESVMYLSVGDICRASTNAFDDRMVCPPTAAMVRAASDPLRTGWGLWSTKGRMWWDDPNSYYSGNGYGSDSIVESAIVAARSARFEHGESGAPAWLR